MAMFDVRTNMYMLVSLDDLRALVKELLAEAKPPAVVDTAGALEILQCSAPTLRKLVRGGKVRRFRGAGGYRFDRRELERYRDGDVHESA